MFILMKVKMVQVKEILKEKSNIKKINSQHHEYKKFAMIIKRSMATRKTPVEYYNEALFNTENKSLDFVQSPYELTSIVSDDSPNTNNFINNPVTSSQSKSPLLTSDPDDASGNRILSSPKNPSGMTDDDSLITDLMNYKGSGDSMEGVNLTKEFRELANFNKMITEANMSESSSRLAFSTKPGVTMDSKLFESFSASGAHNFDREQYMVELADSLNSNNRELFRSCHIDLSKELMNFLYTMNPVYTDKIMCQIRAIQTGDISPMSGLDSLWSLLSYFLPSTCYSSNTMSLPNVAANILSRSDYQTLANPVQPLFNINQYLDSIINLMNTTWSIITHPIIGIAAVGLGTTALAVGAYSVFGIPGSAWLNTRTPLELPLIERSPTQLTQIPSESVISDTSLFKNIMEIITEWVKSGW
jgi:hypothetical protein